MFSEKACRVYLTSLRPSSRCRALVIVLILGALGVAWFSGGVGSASDRAADDRKEQEASQKILDGAPQVYGATYRCADMVRVVNYLRGLGKNGAIAALKRHVA